MIDAAERHQRLRCMIRDVAGLMDRIHYLRLASPPDDRVQLDKVYDILRSAGIELNVASDHLAAPGQVART